MPEQGLSAVAEQTRCFRCLDWNNGDPWYCPRCGRETTQTPHDGGHLGDAAVWTRANARFATDKNG
jgi:hypothetical protein